MVVPEPISNKKSFLSRTDHRKEEGDQGKFPAPSVQEEGETSECDEDRVLGFVASKGDRDLMNVETSRGAEQTVSTAKYEVTGRGGKGRELMQRGQFTRVVADPAVLQGWSDEG